MNIDDNLRVEVSHGHRLFPAVVIDVKDDLITVQYQDGTNQQLKSTPGKLRKSHHCNNNLSLTPEIVQNLKPQETHLEIKSSSTIETEQNVTSQVLECWEKMKFIAKAGENMLILSDLVNNNTQVLDLAGSSESVRLPNSNETENAGDDWSSQNCCVHFEHMKIADEEVQQLCIMSPSVNDEFCKRIEAQKIYFNSVDKNLVVVHNNPETVKYRLDLFQSHHIASLQRMASIAKRVQEQQDLLSEEQSQQRFTKELKVSIELAKYGILDREKGAYFHGKRIFEAKAMPDILEVFVQLFPQGSGESDSLAFVMIRIVAKTQEALDKCASTLTFTELTVYIPNDYTTRVIGKGGRLIQDLINKCGILRVAVLKEDMIPEECVKNNITPFVLIGLESKLQSAKALIDYQISYLQQEETLEAQFKTLQTEIKKTRGHFINTDGETDRLTDSESGLKSDLSIKIPTSWAVPEFPPTEDESKPKPSSSNRPGSAKNNNRNRRNQNTDTEYTDTEAYQSDAGPPSFAQLLNPNARSPRAKKPENKAKGDHNKIIEKSEKVQEVDANNNIIGNGDNSKNNNKGGYKKQQYNNNKQNNNYNSNNSGDKPLPQRTNNNKRQNRNKYSNKQQQQQAQTAQ